MHLICNALLPQAIYGHPLDLAKSSSCIQIFSSPPKFSSSHFWASWKKKTQNQVLPASAHTHTRKKESHFQNMFLMHIFSIVLDYLVRRLFPHRRRLFEVRRLHARFGGYCLAHILQLLRLVRYLQFISCN
jgi:hypothetical protein